MKSPLFPVWKMPEELVLIENLKNENYIKNIVGGLNTLSKKFAELDIKNVKLDFQTNEFQIKVSQKIIRKLKKFNPLILIQNCNFDVINKN